MTGSLKDLFPGYLRPSDEMFNLLWTEATLVPDASALLDLYRVTVATREALLTALSFFKGRVFVPHQFALEFMRNRASVVAEDARAFEEALKQLDELVSRAEQGRSPPAVSVSGLEHLRASRDELQKAFDEQHGLLKHDPIIERLMDIIGSEIGAAPDEKTLAAWSQEAEERYEREQPPGYKDAAKHPPHKYGDLFGWKQVLDWASSNKRHVILVTSDGKEDWWRSTRGYTISPQPALVGEFKKVCSGDFYAYRTNRFVEEAAKYEPAIKDGAAAAKEIARLKQWEEDVGTTGKKKTLAEAAPVLPKGKLKTRAASTPAATDTTDAADSSVSKEES